MLGGDDPEALELVQGLYGDIDAPVCVMAGFHAVVLAWNLKH